MDWLNKLPFFGKKRKQIGYYLGLFLKEDEGIAYALEQTQSGLKAVGEEKFVYTNEWGHIVEDVDQVLVKLEKDVPFHFADTIFFTHSHFIDDVSGEIKKQYLQKIKELVKNLELKALGYIECYEAIVSFVEKRDDIPLTSILLELESKHATVFIYKGGRSVFRKTIIRSEHLVHDLSEVFLEAKNKNILLPSRIIVFSSKDLDHAASVILSHKWPADLFIQHPKVEMIRQDEVREGLISVFESQLAKEETAPQIELAKEPEKKEVLGFVVGEDIATAEPPPAPATFEGSVETEKPAKPSVRTFFKEKLSVLKTKLFTKNSMMRNILIIGGLLLIVTALFLNEYFLHTAVLKVFLPATEYKKEISLLASADGGGEFPIVVSTQSAELTRSAATTGSREVGEKAKGEVTIYSFDSAPRTIGKNTVLTLDGLQFFTEQDVQVASASEAFVGGNLVKQPGKTKVEVVAEEIGTQYNADKGERFKVGDLSETIYFGQNDNALSGGTKKTVKTVARKDIDDLETALLRQVSSSEATLLKNSKASLKALKNLTEVELVNTNSSKEVGEEADKVTLSSTGMVTYYLYDENKLKDVIGQQFADELPDGFSIHKDKTIYRLDSAEKDGNEISLDLTANVKATQDIPQEDIMSAVKFKSRGELDTLLKERYKVTGYELKVSNPLPFLKDRAPIFDKNLVVLITSL